MVLIWHNRKWASALHRFGSRVWDEFIHERVGSTSPGFVNSIIVSVGLLVVLAFLILLDRGLAAMKKHIVETAFLSVVALGVVLLTVYGTQMIWEVAHRVLGT